MFILIANNEISGNSVIDTGLPEGFVAVTNDTDVNELDQLYWDGQNVQVKPPKPGDGYMWVNGSNQWVEIPTPYVYVTRIPFMGGALFKKAREAGKTRMDVQMELTIALSAEAQQDWNILDECIDNLEKMLNG